MATPTSGARVQDQDIRVDRYQPRPALYAEFVADEDSYLASLEHYLAPRSSAAHISFYDPRDSRTAASRRAARTERKGAPASSSRSTHIATAVLWRSSSPLLLCISSTTPDHDRKRPSLTASRRLGREGFLAVRRPLRCGGLLALRPITHPSNSEICFVLVGSGRSPGGGVWADLTLAHVGQSRTTAAYYMYNTGLYAPGLPFDVFSPGGVRPGRDPPMPAVVGAPTQPDIQVPVLPSAGLHSTTA
ncbi:hypothetical protein B0H10DRAFT_2431636 [Mycena sp. CBHHK59/15]|nr:hypothetical protein B0H10DRAFT_2431636 [Mycena sp. CBHHK59/15]